METLELSKHFRDLDHDQFCSWLRQNDLDVLEKLIRDGSDVKPSDLLPSLFDDGPLGFRAIIEDEIGAGISVKLTLIMRLRNAMAVAANLERPAAEKTSATKHSTAVGIQEAPTKKKAWGEMVEADKRKTGTPNDRAVVAELSSGRVYIIPANSAPHGAFFDADPKKACALIPGVTFVSKTTTVVARGDLKPAYKVSFSGDFLSKMVAAKRGNHLYKPVAGHLVDYAGFWGYVGKAYSEGKKDQLSVDKSLAKKNSPSALRAIRDLEIQRSRATHEVKISCAEKERITLEEGAAGGDFLAASRLRKMHNLTIDLRRDKATDEATITAKFERPIVLSEARETNQAAKKSDNKRKRRIHGSKGKGINSDKRRRGAYFDEEDDVDSAAEGGSEAEDGAEAERGAEEGRAEGVNETEGDVRAEGEGGIEGEGGAEGHSEAAAISALTLPTVAAVGGFLVPPPADDDTSVVAPSVVAPSASPSASAPVSVSASVSASASPSASASAASASASASAATENIASVRGFWMTRFS